ncbi:MAG: helix-turn-helix protein [Syntrophus sp. PtaB.Bin138]|nr:MAG: helix-turn-helix protein [Syntrophus sp. PtaB.Bin138]
MSQNETDFKNIKLCDIDRRIQNNLIRLRMARNLTQQALSDLSGVSHVGQIEAGHAKAGKQVVSKLARALQIDPLEFYLPDNSPDMLKEITQACAGLSTETQAHVLEMVKSLAVLETRINWRE